MPSYGLMSAETVRRIGRYYHQTKKQDDKHQYDGYGSEESQLLTDDGEDHIVLGLGDDHLLHALPQSLAHQAA